MYRISTLLGFLLTLTAPLNLAVAAGSSRITAAPVVAGSAAAAAAATEPAARHGPRDLLPTMPLWPAQGRDIPRESRGGRPPWSWPLSPEPGVVHAFAPPATPYGSGHRGVDLGPRSAVREVRAVASGVVTHAGVIAGVGTVSVTHPGEIKSTYQPVTAIVRRGDHVGAGSLLGTLDHVGSHCAPTPCLHLGALRRDSAGEWKYIDPLLLLGRVVIVLLPERAGG